jgi:L-lactate dehydrogenase
MKHSKIAVIGAGRVGTTTAYALMLKNIAAEILLVDIDPARCKGEFLDLEDALSFCATSDIKDATLSQAAQADIIIITAGIAQKQGQPRSELLATNKKIIDSIAQGLHPINPNAIIIMVSNPLDALALHLKEKKLVPDNQIFGSGTFLDSMRLTGFIAHKFNIAPESIHAWVLGEHGESQFVPWSCVIVDGTPIKDLCLTQNDLEEFTQKTRKKVYNIIECKGATFYGIATCTAVLCESIVFNQRKVLPVSTYCPEFGVYMSVPCILGERGIEGRFPISLSPEETISLNASALAIKNNQ